MSQPQLRKIAKPAHQLPLQPEKSQIKIPRAKMMSMLRTMFQKRNTQNIEASKNQQIPIENEKNNAR